MPISIGLKTHSHVFICSESIVSESVIQIKEDEDRTELLGNNLVNITGEEPDSAALWPLISESSKYTADLYRTPLTPRILAETARSIIHSGLRSDPTRSFVLIAGHSPLPELYCVDPYGATFSDNLVVTGYGLYFVLGIYDQYYKYDMNINEANEFIKRCLTAIKEHLYIKSNKWILKSINKEGECDVMNISI